MAAPAHHLDERIIQQRKSLTGLNDEETKYNKRRFVPADGSSTRGGSTSVRGRVRTPHTAELPAASVPIAYGSCAPRAGTDRRTNGWMAVPHNATPTARGGHNNELATN